VNVKARSQKAARPFVTANFAITADGRISTRNLTPADFSSKRDKRRLVEIRATCDAVLAGNQTIAADNMTMGLPVEELRAARIAKGLPPYPLRVVLSHLGRINPELRLFTKTFSPIIIFSTTRMSHRLRETLAGKATLYLHEERVNLAEMLRTLRAKHGVRRLVCEGGAQVLRSLLAEQLVDELHVTICPRIFGGSKAPTLTGIAGEYLPTSIQLELREMEIVDAECFLRYRVVR
jgi:riboflavin-specific deaminase-like protein